MSAYEPDEPLPENVDLARVAEVLFSPQMRKRLDEPVYVGRSWYWSWFDAVLRIQALSLLEVAQWLFKDLAVTVSQPVGQAWMFKVERDEKDDFRAHSYVHFVGHEVVDEGPKNFPLIRRIVEEEFFPVPPPGIAYDQKCEGCSLPAQIVFGVETAGIPVRYFGEWKVSGSKVYCCHRCAQNVYRDQMCYVAS